jgi:hypothetical protein
LELMGCLVENQSPCTPNFHDADAGYHLDWCQVVAYPMIWQDFCQLFGKVWEAILLTKIC